MLQKMENNKVLPLYFLVKQRINGRMWWSRYTGMIACNAVTCRASQHVNIVPVHAIWCGWCVWRMGVVQAGCERLCDRSRMLVIWPMVFGLNLVEVICSRHRWFGICKSAAKIYSCGTTAAEAACECSSFHSESELKLLDRRSPISSHEQARVPVYRATRSENSVFLLEVAAAHEWL